jgi:hypothetical protein
MPMPCCDQHAVHVDAVQQQKHSHVSSIPDNLSHTKHCLCMSASLCRMLTMWSTAGQAAAQLTVIGRVRLAAAPRVGTHQLQQLRDWWQCLPKESASLAKPAPSGKHCSTPARKHCWIRTWQTLIGLPASHVQHTRYV